MFSISLKTYNYRNKVRDSLRKVFLDIFLQFSAPLLDISRGRNKKFGFYKFRSQAHC